MPAVNLRASTAYGTNTTPLISGRANAPVHNEQLGSFLHGILDKEDKADANATSKFKHLKLLVWP